MNINHSLYRLMLFGLLWLGCVSIGAGAASDAAIVVAQSGAGAQAVLEEVAAHLEAGHIDQALTHFTGAPQNREVLTALTPAHRRAMAASLRTAKLIDAKNNLRTYEIAWKNDDGTPLALRMSMSRTADNKWFIVSW